MTTTAAPDPEPRQGGSRGPQRVGTANLRDVARLAGVSPATVSRVFGGNDRVNEAARARVLAAADELGYVVNGLARAMMGRGRRTVAFVVREMVGPTFASMAAGVEQVATDNGFLFLISTTHGDGDRERELIDTLREQRAAAVMLVGSASTDPLVEQRIASYVGALDAVDAKLILCGRPPLLGHPGVPSVDYDHAGGVREAVLELVRLGHRSIAFIGDQPGATTPERRLSGYRAALEESGIAAHAGLIVPAANYVEDGEAAVMRLLESGLRPTALMCQTDNLAIGAYRALRKRGIRIPDDMSVVGFDDMPIVGDLTPGLTTIRAPFGEVGVRAARLALEVDPYTENLLLPTELVIRGSTGAAPTNF